MSENNRKEIIFMLTRDDVLAYAKELKIPKEQITGEAIELYQQSADTFARLEQSLDVGRALSNMGFSHFGLGDHKEAIRCYQKALELLRKVGDVREQGLVYLHMAEIALAQEELAEARANCTRATRRFRRIGFELGVADVGRVYAGIARQVIIEERTLLGEAGAELTAEVITGNAANITDHIFDNQIPIIDYVITSPPYWDMLHARGAKIQKRRRESQDLDVTYSDDPNDLGNIADYDDFLKSLTSIYSALKDFIRPRAYMTIIVKNIKKEGKIYPLAWDLARLLKNTYTLKDEKIWCQDNQRLAPYGFGNAWVSNTFHHYCLQFRNDIDK